VQTATGHRSDIPAISGIARQVGAIVFVDGSQLVGALNVADDLPAMDVLVVPDHKFLLHAGRGMGYCYLAPSVQRTFAPINAGWRAGAVPFESFSGPQMNLSPPRRVSTPPSAGWPRPATELRLPTSTTTAATSSSPVTEN
jgi:selenocysteine lyase/cysteine desulfurase